MTHLDDEELRVLSGARAAFGPTAGVQARVRAATLRALAAGGAAAAAGPATSFLGEATRRVVVRSAGAAAVVALALGAGYRIGHDAALREAPPAAVVRQVISPAPPRSEPVPPDVAHPPEPAPHPANVASAPRPKAAPPDTLGEEVRVLREVDRALREQRPLIALELLNELDRAVPKGRLHEERTAARVLARCDTSSRAEAQQLGVTFSKEHPGSVYEPRVLRGCGAASPAPEAHAPREP
jgi:hypothetical protein